MADQGADMAQQQSFNASPSLEENGHVNADRGGDDQGVPPSHAYVAGPLLRSAANKSLLIGLPANLGKPSTMGGGKGKGKGPVLLTNPGGNGVGDGPGKDADGFSCPTHPVLDYGSESDAGSRGTGVQRGRHPKRAHFPHRGEARLHYQGERSRSHSGNSSVSRSPPRRREAYHGSYDRGQHRYCVPIDQYEKLQQKYDDLQKRLASMTPGDQRGTEHASLRKDVAYWKAKYVKSTNQVLCLGLGCKPPGGEQTHPFTQIFEITPLTEEERGIYDNLSIPLHMVIISTTLFRLCCEGLPQGSDTKKTVFRLTNSLVANAREFTTDCQLEVVATASIDVFLWSQVRGESDSVTQFGTLKLAAWVVPDEFLHGHPFLAGNLLDVHMSGTGRFDFSKEDYVWSTVCDVNLDQDRSLSTPTMPFSKRMYDMSTENKTSSNYLLAGSQWEAGLGKRVASVEELSEWGYMEGEDGELVKVKLNRSTSDKSKGVNISSKFQGLSIPSGEKDSYEYVNKPIPRVLNLGKGMAWSSLFDTKARISGSPDDSTEGPQLQGPMVNSNQGSTIKNPSPLSPGKGLKKGFYNQGKDTESFEDVCSTSKWSTNGHLLNGLSVSFAGEKYDLATALSVAAVCDGIPLVMPDAPLDATTK